MGCVANEKSNHHWWVVVWWWWCGGSWCLGLHYLVVGPPRWPYQPEIQIIPGGPNNPEACYLVFGVVVVVCVFTDYNTTLGLC
jgi:hypothetical protein